MSLITAALQGASMTLQEARQLAAQITRNRLQSEQANRQFRQNPDAFLQSIEGDISKALASGARLQTTVEMRPTNGSVEDALKVSKPSAEHLQVIAQLSNIIKTYLPTGMTGVQEALDNAEKLLKT